MINSLLYIGSGLHIEIFKDFPYVKKFVLVDTLPRSPYDLQNTFCNRLYKKNFVGDLISLLSKNNFTLTSITKLDEKYHEQIFSTKQKIYYEMSEHKIPEFINPTLLIFNNIKSNQMIKYYISTNFQLNLDEELFLDIKEVDGIIVCAHHPNKQLLDLLDRPIKFYGYSSTSFSYNPENLYLKNTIVEWIYENPVHAVKYFNEFYSVDKKNSNIYQVKNIFELNISVCILRKKHQEQSTEFDK